MTRPLLRNWWGSLRVRLAVTGFATIYIPILVVLGVTIAEEASNVSTVVVPGGLEVVEDVDVVSTPSPLPRPLATATVIALAPVAAALAWWWAGRAVRPIDAVRATAEEIEAGRLDRRLDLRRGPTEIVALGRSFDAMLDRLATSAETQRHLIEETSHELRNPLAVLTTNAEVLLKHPEPTIEVYREGIERSRLTAERLSAVVDGLLVDARGRARTIDRHPCDLVATVRRVVATAEPLASAAGVTTSIDGPDELSCRLDEQGAERAIANLYDNAIQHSPVGATIEIELRDIGDLVEVSIVDQGAGVDDAEQARLFERYWRADDDGRGTGLGLLIARQIAEAHGGSVTLRSPGPSGGGSVFTISFSR